MALQETWFSLSLSPSGTLKTDKLGILSNPPKNPKRQYKNKFPSVTEILGVIRKPGLEYWLKAREAAQINEITKMALDVGNAVHELIEVYCGAKKDMQICTQHPIEVSNAWESFLNFILCEAVKIVETERLMTIDEFGVQCNGTMDAIGRMPNGEEVVLDWKTGDGEFEDLTIYTEYKAQAAAYAHMDAKSIEDLKPTMIVKLSKTHPGEFRTAMMGKDQVSWYFDEIFKPAYKLYMSMKVDKEVQKNEKTSEKKRKKASDKNGVLKTTCLNG